MKFILNRTNIIVEGVNLEDVSETGANIEQATWVRGKEPKESSLTAYTSTKETREKSGSMTAEKTENKLKPQCESSQTRGTHKEKKTKETSSSKELKAGRMTDSV